MVPLPNCDKPVSLHERNLQRQTDVPIGHSATFLYSEGAQFDQGISPAFEGVHMWGQVVACVDAEFEPILLQDRWHGLTITRLLGYRQSIERRLSPFGACLVITPNARETSPGPLHRSAVP